MPFVDTSRLDAIERLPPKALSGERAIIVDDPLRAGFGGGP
jgi:hypothetical protein